LYQNQRSTPGLAMENNFRAAMMSRVLRGVPQSVTNRLLLALPRLYGLPLISYETRMDPDRLADIYSCLDQVKGIRADVIECGCFRCGTSILIAKFLGKEFAGRKIFACDTFEGFDESELRAERLKGLRGIGSNRYRYNSYDYVTLKIQRLGYSDVIKPVKGHFRNTLDSLLANSFSFALIDCDLSESVAYSASKVFPSIVNGGIMLFDDYLSPEFKGVRTTVDKFVVDHEEEIGEHYVLRRMYCVRKASHQ